MYKRPHHRRIATALNALNAELLKEHHCYFGGGTAIALHYGEYRESIDIDFLVSNKASYRALRELVKTADSIVPLLLPNTAALVSPQEVKTDQYGIRSKFLVDGQLIKFEIVLEGRIEFDQPGLPDQIVGVTTLTATDQVASKLLANSDRWADEGVLSRDIIDLAMIEIKPKQLKRALSKASDAYGQAIVRDFNKAYTKLSEQEGWIDRCIQKMDIDLPKALLLQRLKSLARKLG